MTTNQTIDGVPRELLERLLIAVTQDFATIGEVRELRALLDADRCTSCDGSGEYIDALGDWRGYCSCAAGVALESKPAAQPQGEPVAWKNFDGEGGFDFTEDKETAERWKISNGSFTGWLTPLYAEQSAPVAVDETAEFSKWTHEVIAESRIGDVTLKVQRMQHLTPSEEKSAHDAWMARAALNAKSR